MTKSRTRRRPGQKTLDFERTKAGKIPVNKLDAARRQLETAVTLWFHDGDPVSVHTLLMAAHEILRVINRARSGPPMMGEPCPQIRQEYSDVWRELFSESSHFFKHSSRDAGETHYFSPRINNAVILDATECYQRLTHDVRPLFRIFKWYMRVHAPALFLECPLDAPDLKRLSKPQFFGKLIGIASDPQLLSAQLEPLEKLLGNRSK